VKREEMRRTQVTLGGRPSQERDRRRIRPGRADEIPDIETSVKAVMSVSTGDPTNPTATPILSAGPRSAPVSRHAASP
jgi:hypothetical protein